MLLLIFSASAWTSASSTSAGTGGAPAPCTISGIDGNAMHTHGGPAAQLSGAHFQVICAAQTTLSVDQIEFLTGHSCDVPPATVLSKPKVGGLFVPGMIESALTLTIGAGLTPTELDVSFSPVEAYMSWCDRFAFRVHFRVGATPLVSVAETVVMREEPLRE